MNCRVEVYPSGNTSNTTHYKWRIRNAAGRIIAHCAEPYTSKGGCERAISVLATMFEEGRIEGVPDWPTDSPKVEHISRMDMVDS